MEKNRSMNANDKKFLKYLGKLMWEHPENFMFNEDGVIFSKCNSCTDWHPIIKMSGKIE